MKNNETNKIPKIKNTTGKFDENKIQAIYNYLCEKIGNERKSLNGKTISMLAEKAYPEHSRVETEEEILLYIFTRLLQYTDNSSFVATGKILEYINYLNNNREVDVNRSVARYILKNATSEGKYIFNTRGDLKTTCKELYKIKNRSIKMSQKKIKFANKFKKATSLYYTHVKSEEDLVKRLLKVLKDEAFFIQRVDEEIAIQKEQYEIVRLNESKEYGINMFDKEFYSLINSKNRKGNSNLLVNFIVTCKDTFVKYFLEYQSLLDNPKWFVEEFINNNQNDDNKNSFRDNFAYIPLIDDKLEINYTTNQSRDINYDNLQRRLCRE